MSVGAIQNAIPFLRPEDGERRLKTLISVDNEERGVWVDVTIQLDETDEHERRVLQDFETYDGRLNVRYFVYIDLAARAASFSRELTELFDTPGLGDALRMDSGSVLNWGSRARFLKFAAEHGASLFDKLFVNWDPRQCTSHAAHEVSTIRAALLSALRRRQILVIRATLPLLPWPFVYDEPHPTSLDDESIEVGAFWGFKHELQQDLDCTSKHIWVPNKPSIYTGICSIEDHGRHAAADHPLSLHRGVREDAASIRDFAKALSAFNYDCLYFYGHSFHSDPPSAVDSYLELNRDQVTVATLDSVHRAPQLKANPVIVFINGCRTAPLTTWNEESIVGFLCLKSDRRICCIATIGEIPASLAAEFARGLWQEFLQNRDHIGQAVLGARRRLLDDFHNPLGLLYTLFGCADTRCRASDVIE